MEDRITIKDTSHVARLGNLDLSDNELEKLTDMFSDTLDYIKVLEELDTSEVSATFQVTGLKNIYQEADLNRELLSQSEALENAPKVKEGKFSTDAVFDR